MENKNDNMDIDLDALGEAGTPANGEAADTEKKEKKEKEKKAPAIPEGSVTAEDLAKEYGMTGRDLRVFLRSLYKDHSKGGRWFWSADSEELKKVKAALDERKAKAEARKAEAAANKDKPKEKKTKEKAASTDVTTPDPVDPELEGIEL